MTRALVLAAIALTGCATATVSPVVSGGSKADGVVELRGEYGMARSLAIDWNAANQRALDACRAWGFSSAKPFDTYDQRCADNEATPVGCLRSELRLRYQCGG